jgi:hypothetical protein
MVLCICIARGSIQILLPLFASNSSTNITSPRILRPDPRPHYFLSPSHFFLHPITFHPQGALFCSSSPHNPEPDLRSLLTRRVPAHVGLVDEETPHGVEYCEDDHGEKLEEGEDVGSTPHVSRGTGEVAVCGRCIDKWFSAKQDEGLLLLILWLRGCTEERMCLL